FPRWQALPGMGGQGWGPANRPEPRLGAQVRKPSATLVEQLDLPKDQGVVLEEVGANSAAAKAGLKPHDIVLELNGKTVPNSVGEFAKLLKDVKANTPVDVVVLRKGKKGAVKGLKRPGGGAGVPAAPAVPPLALPGFGQGFGQNFGRGFGGGMTSIARNNDQFTTKHRSGDLTITIQGSVDQGQ